MMPPITLTQFTNWVSGNGLKRDYVSGMIFPQMQNWQPLQAKTNYFLCIMVLTGKQFKSLDNDPQKMEELRVLQQVQ